MQIQFYKLKENIELLSSSILYQVALEAPTAAKPVQLKVLADKSIGPKIEPEKEKQEEQYKNLLKDKDKLAQESTVSPQMARIIR